MCLSVSAPLPSSGLTNKSEMTFFLFSHRSQESAGIEKRPIKFLFCLKREVSSHNESADVFLLSEAFASRPGD